jgi:hypothetical protein
MSNLMITKIAGLFSTGFPTPPDENASSVATAKDVEIAKDVNIAKDAG